MNGMHIFTGHYGSGKTAIAVNWALTMPGSILVDLDIVNAYFRANDYRSMLESRGVTVLASQFAGTNVDIPALPPNIMMAFTDKSRHCILDVGGDGDGALVLSGFRQHLDRYDMYLVINIFRPEQSSVSLIKQMLEEIEYKSRLKISGLINNSNLMSETTYEHILEGQKMISEAAQQLGVPLSYTCVAPQFHSVQVDNPVFLLDKQTLQQGDENI